MQEINIPGVGAVNFPSSMSDEDIKDAIKTKILPKYGNGASAQKSSPQNSLSKFLGQAANAPTTNFVLGAGDAVMNLPRSLANLVSPKSLQTPLAKTGSGASYDAGKAGGELTSFLGGGEALSGARAASEAIPYAGKLAEKLGAKGVAPAIGRQVSGGALYGASQDPGDPLSGAEIGGALGGATGALGGILEKLSPSSLYRGNLSPQELQRNSRVAGNTQTPLGDVIESPKLKKLYENVLPKSVLSTVDREMGNTAEAVKKKGNDILEGYRGDIPHEMVPGVINEALANAGKAQKAEKNKLYTKANNLAEKEDLNLDLDSFYNTAQKYRNIIDDQSFLKTEPESRALISRLRNYKQPTEAINEFPELIKSGFIVDGVPLAADVVKKSPSLKEANVLSGKLNSLAKQHGASINPSDHGLAKVFSELGRSLKSDIKTSLGNHPNKELLDTFSEAEKNYKENYSPFLDKDIWNFSNRNKSSDDLISTFIKTGSTTDKGGQLGKLMSKLPTKAQDLVKYEYLSRALEGDDFGRSVNPMKMKTLWSDSKLGQRQKSVLMNPEERKTMDDYSKLTKMNSEALTRMFNPKTGVRNSDFFPVAQGITAGVGGVGGIMQGGLSGAALGAASTVGPVIAGRAASKYLTSPDVRRELIDKMVNGKDPSQMGAISRALAQILASDAKKNRKQKRLKISLKGEE